MKRHKTDLQRTLFESEAPAWNMLTAELQQSLTEVISQLLLEALQHRQSHPGNDNSTHKPNIEDPHVP